MSVGGGLGWIVICLLCQLKPQISYHSNAVYEKCWAETLNIIFTSYINFSCSYVGYVYFLFSQV